MTGPEQVRRHVLNGLVPQDAGVVDDDVDPVEGVEGGLDDRLASLGRGDAVGVGDRLPALIADLLGHRLGQRGIRAFAVERAAGVVDDDARAPGRQQQGVLLAQAPAGAGHDGHLPVKAEFVHGGRG